MTAHSLAELLGVALEDPLAPSEVARLLRPLPGYASVLRDIPRHLTVDADVLHLKDLSPTKVQEIVDQQERLTSLESALKAVQRAVFEQRMEADDEAMRVLFKIARRVQGMAEDDPTLPGRWRFLLDYVNTFRSNGGDEASKEKKAKKEKSPGAVPTAAAGATDRGGGSDDPERSG
ncbi:MAG: hypothetical protein HY909_08515 [Deltaproteobacteria bacterium]|nr:hypothetical protein [Deltaproteobacteria bacterium]